MDLMILESIDLKEISSVDDPAQPTAKATIIKRTTKQEPDMSDKNTDVTKALDEQKATLEADFAKKLDEVTADLVKKQEFILSLSDAELGVYKALDAKSKKELDEMDDDEKKKKLTQKSANDEIVKFEGKEIRKSVVGTEAFELYKRMEALEFETAKALDKAHLTALEKRADDEFGSLAGTSLEKAEVIKAVEGLDSKSKDYLLAVMKQANDANKEAFVTKGSTKEADEAKSKLEKRNQKIEEIVKSENVSRHVAMEKAARQNPELFSH